MPARVGAQPARTLKGDGVAGDDLTAHWSDDGRWLWYSLDTSDGSLEYFKVDLSDGVKTPLLDVAKTASALSRSLDDEVLASDLRGLRYVSWDADQERVKFRFRDQLWALDAEGELEALEFNAGDLQAFWTRSTRSRNGGPETHLTFHNKMSVDVKCFWLAGDGRAIEYETLAADQQMSQHTFVGHLWSLRDAHGKELARLAAHPELGYFELTPDLVAEYQRFRQQKPADDHATKRKRSDEVFVRDHNIWIHRTDAEHPEQLTNDGTAQHPYRSPSTVSPSGRYLAALRVQVVDERHIHMIESSPGRGQQPKLHSLQYTKPGDAIDLPTVVLLDLESGELQPVPADLMSNPWSLTRLQWIRAATDEERLLVLYNQRGHQCLRVLSIAAETGQVDKLIEETSPTFIDYAHKTTLRQLNDGSELLWMSERSGHNHLYRFSAADGQMLGAVTSGEWVVRGIEKVDDAEDQIWLSVSGIVPNQDPYYRHLVRVNFDGTELTILTNGDGDHQWEFSPDGRWFIDRYSRVDLPPVSVLRDATDGRLVCELATADWSGLLASGWTIPERWTAKGRDGTTDIYGIIVRPGKLQSDTAYPIIEKIYAGPHGAHVPKSFSRLRQEHRLANQGFIVVRIDGMGTSHRGKKFHDVCWKNLADAGFPDRIAWITAAAERYPEFDLSRVGIFGGSAGGQNAMRALIDHHDFYSVAVADCGCHDNRMDKIWWNEAWMGWPVDEAYARSSNVEHAHRLEGQLMLIVGELDRNVDPASTMQVVDALVRADKDFDLLIMPGVGHGAAETPYASRRRTQFLKRHLIERRESNTE